MTSAPIADLRTVRAPLGEGTLQALTQLDRQCFHQSAWSASSWRSTLALEGVALHLYEVDGTTYGFALVCCAADEAELLKIAVVGTARRHGVGRSLLVCALSSAARRGARTMHLELASNNQPALGLYRSHGFRAVGRRGGYYRDGSDAILLARELAGTPEPPRRPSAEALDAVTHAEQA